MTQNQERNEDRLYGPQKSKSITSRTSPTTSMPTITTEDEVVAEVDEPPENGRKLGIKTDFHRSNIRPNNDRQTSLLTKALLNSPDSDTFRPELQLVTEIGRRRSVNSNTSSASSMELTSDGGLTSPTRTNTPSPPFPSTLEENMALLNVGSKEIPRSSAQKHQEPNITRPNDKDYPDPPKTVSTVETLTKKRCITFACGGQKPPQQALPKTNTSNQPTEKVTPSISGDSVPQRRACAIKFACPATVKQGTRATTLSKTPEPAGSRSPTAVRKVRSTQSPRTSPVSSRRLSQSPVATRKKRPIFLTANQSGEATRFHEFASDVVEEEDWIRRDSSDNKKKITINDILRKENAIRQLGKEAEEEALEEEEEEDEEDNEQDDDDDEDEDNEDSDDAEGEYDQSDDDADVGDSDGNETDNEAGFAESDDESDSEEFRFWTTGRSIPLSPTTQRVPPHRTTSESSIDSPKLLSLPVPWSDASTQQRKLKSPRRPKIRPGTPDLPDSTDFVCGTLDEDRPLEDAYVSCMEVRKRERHRMIPQDIDPSFPTSDPEHEDEDEDDDYKQNDSDEPLFIHGKFEEDENDQGLRRPRTRKSPLQSPKRMHSPPPKHRLRSPAPRRHFGGASPRRMRSPLSSREANSPTKSPVHPAAISFAPLGPRPGLTHTKSLPRTTNAFCKQYRAACLAAANANLDEETTDGYTRGAIDIVKGLERKRQHRREKLLRKQNNRARKGGPVRKPQPGKGAERMRELGLHMAGKGGVVKAEYVLSI